ncbi:hypothetical protein HDU98_007246 [Podochytrium sp. JEL0797]|nr:hypothetical protein HDU98_007246 [Podochytrium sp. JEL0797]
MHASVCQVCETNRNDASLLEAESALDRLSITPAEPKYKLIWSDEFTGPTLNMDNWSYYLGIHATENSINTPENVCIRDGKLVITPTYDDGKIYSGRIETKDKVIVTQGCRLEVRAKMPRGTWMWPAIWLWSQWETCNELDLVEMAGYEPDKVEGSVHLYKEGGEDVAHSNRITLPFDMTDEFHVYSMEWTADTIVYRVDDILVKDLNYAELYPPQTLTDDEMFVVLNVAVGGYYFGKDEVPKDNAVLAEDVDEWQPMLVDYARLYKRTEK